jgi:hypothetical protein
MVQGTNSKTYVRDAPKSSRDLSDAASAHRDHGAPAAIASAPELGAAIRA